VTVNTNRVTLDNATPIISRDWQNTLEVFEDSDRVKAILDRALSKYPQINSLAEFPEPYDMKGIEEAVGVFTTVVAENGKIKVVCDSDMDGLGCYTLWYKFFTYFPYSNVEIIITDRKQGYGFIPLHVDENTSLYITSDNGITAVPATQAARDKGASVIICDHHQPDLEAGLPNANAIVDPYQPDDNFPWKDISGTFVLWFLLKALVEKYNIEVDMYHEFLPELALTTLSDVMPINKHINRYVVTDFIAKFSASDHCHREYLNTFRTEINDSPRAEDFSFGLTPMINATQRLTTAAHGAQFLIAEGREKSLEWFNFLKGINDARKERQQSLLTYIEKYYKEYINQPFIVIPGNFNSEFKGVLGIIAGRLADKHHKPCIVLNLNPATNDYSGSGRSTGNLNILDLLRENPHITNVGGHKQALGMTVPKDNFDEFYTLLQSKTGEIPPDVLNPKKLPLGFIPINKIDIEFFRGVNELEPYGQGFKRPTFVTRALLKTARLVGKQKNHLTVTITDSKKLLKFSGMQFFTTDLPETGKEYMISFHLDEDTFRGTGKVQLKITDMVPIKEDQEN